LTSVKAASALMREINQGIDVADRHDSSIIMPESPMTRSSALRVGATVALVGAVALGVARCDPQPTMPKASAKVTLVYVGAEDCAPCRAWQGGERKRFLESGEASRLTYREVKSPTLRDVLKDEHWPEDLRGHRDRLGAGAGVPLWLVISGDELVERAFGASQWHGTVLPRLRRLLR
jgi:hypothetical protein